MTEIPMETSAAFYNDLYGENARLEGNICAHTEKEERWQPAGNGAVDLEAEKEVGAENNGNM
jgi:hypothetical protein